MERIESLDDPRIAAYRNLPDRTLRGESIFLAEGLLVTERLLRSNYGVQSVLVAEEYASHFATLLGDRGRLFVGTEALLRSVVGFQFHRGALAMGVRQHAPALGELRLPAQGRCGLIACPEITKPENMGLIFRSAAALGLHGVVLGQRCCDPFSRRCLRVSMGAALQVPYARVPDFPTAVQALEHQHQVSAVAAVLEGGVPLPQFDWPPRAVVVLGNEFWGLDEPSLAACRHRVTIPMAEGVNSLNLGVAAGILAYQWRFA